MKRPPPRALPVKPENIPELLKGYPNWVCWAYEWREKNSGTWEWTKVPKNPRTGKNAKANDRETWGTFDEAWAFYSKGQNNGIAGIGFELGDKDSPCVGWDFDHCRDKESGKVNGDTAAMVERLNTYTEISPSGTGVRTWAIGTLPPNGRKKGDIECYDSVRFLTMTGHHLEGTPKTIEERSDAIETIHRQVFGDQKQKQQTTEQKPAQPVSLEDEELLRKARVAANGDLFSKLYDRGDWSDYPSQSEADSALCCNLAFWSGNDVDRIDRFFRQSALYREKWDKPHFADGRTYGQETIRKAVERTSETYTPRGKSGGQEMPGTEPKHSEAVKDVSSSPRPAELSAATIKDCIDASLWLEEEPPPADQFFEDTFDKGDKVAVIGQSKVRKSFFLMQMLLCIASGKSFLLWQPTKARRVFLVQFEVKKDHYHRRIKNMARALGIEPEDIRDRLKILNARGLGITGPSGIALIGQIAAEWQPDIIAFDPLYKITEGDENKAEDMKRTLQAFDVVAEQTGATIMYVHHDPKGFAGERDIRDRGAGSNSLGRDYDACITLTPHATEETAIVVETLLRNYRPQEPFTALWDANDEAEGYKFVEGIEIAPVKKTSKNSNPGPAPIDAYRDVVFSFVKEGPKIAGSVLEELYRQPGLAQKRAKEILSLLISGPTAPLHVFEKRGRGIHEKWVGTPNDIRKMRGENE